jgi:MOSC domain-containing protein YiiM
MEGEGNAQAVVRRRADGGGHTLSSMIGSEPAFAACLAAALGIDSSTLPAPEGDPQVFWRQWLAGRNLGLVPVDDPESFSWPGFWIAACESGEGGRDALLMFGVPSGVVLNPAGIVGDDRSPLAEAVLVAPFQLGLDPSTPYGTPTGEGAVAGVLVAPEAQAALARVDAAEAVPGAGLVGDRYARRAGTFSGDGRGYELTLIEAEALEALGAEGVEITWEQARRNVVTRGIRLNALVGHRFRIGSVECVGRRLAEPCAHLQRLAPAGILRGLVHRGGLRADILTGGEIRAGDLIVPLPDASPSS